MIAATKNYKPKPSIVLSNASSCFIRKRRLMSQRTLDTNQDREEQNQNQNRFNQEQLLKQIKEALKIVQNYKDKIVFKKEPTTIIEQCRHKEDIIMILNKQINQIQDEIGRLKEIYKRPRQYSPANYYTSTHLKPFSLADEIVKQRKHLQLHIEQHSKLKMRANLLHRNIKQKLTQYADFETKKGFKPISYGQFRKNALVQKRENNIKRERSNSLSSRSISQRKRSSSIKSIISKDSSTELLPSQKNMWQMQRRKSITNRAKEVNTKKHDRQYKEMLEQINFLKQEDGTLAIKLQELIDERTSLQNNINSSQYYPSISRRSSKTNL